MKAKLITNPYIVYSLGFLLTLLLYDLQWSNLYPVLSSKLVAFIIATAFFSFLIGLLFHKPNYLSFKDVSYSSLTLWIVTIIVFISYALEFKYMGVVPLFAILNGTDYDYRTFGIPTFHVIVVTFNSFWTVFIFHNYISQKKKNLLLCFILSLIPAVLIFNRGMLLLNLASSLFVWLMSAKKLRKSILKVVLLLGLILFLFGLLGNIRISGGESLNDIILDVGHASHEFRSSDIPKEFFWSYLYVTSPLANLQNTINLHYISSFSSQKLGTFINRVFMPDFIAKRIVNFLEPYEGVNKISASFTVGTVYGRSYAYFGWWGLALMYIFILLFNLFIILSLSKNSSFFVTGIAILDCIMLFNIFDNMFYFSGLSFQLFYPIVFGFFSNVDYWKRN